LLLPYLILGRLNNNSISTWIPILGALVIRFERYAGNPPAYSFIAPTLVPTGSTIIMTAYYYDTASSTGVLVPIDLGFVSSAKSEATQYIYEYEADSFLSYLYNAPINISAPTPLSSIVSNIVSSLNSSLGLEIIYSPRAFESSIVIEPGRVSKFADIISLYFGGGLDYAVYFGTLEITTLSTIVGSSAPILVSVKSVDAIDGYVDSFNPVILSTASTLSYFEAVPSLIGTTQLAPRRILKVVTKTSRISTVIYVSPPSTVCLGVAYNEACYALDYKLNGSIDVWLAVPNSSSPSGYVVVAKLCCRGQVGSITNEKCDYSVDMGANEKVGRLVLTFRDEVVGNGAYFLVVMDAVKVFYIEDDTSPSSQSEIYPVNDYGDASSLFPEYPSGTYFKLSTDGGYIKSRDPRLYMMAKPSTTNKLGKLMMVPGTPFFKRNVLQPEASTLSGFLTNAVVNYGGDPYVVGMISIGEDGIIYQMKPKEYYLSYIESIESIRRKQSLS
jgi:hypothetical protein